jgi:hypothetical protein
MGQYRPGSGNPVSLSSPHVGFKFCMCRDGDLGAKTLAYSKGLETSFAELSKALNNSSDFNPSINFEGIIGLATEVPDKKVTQP